MKKTATRKNTTPTLEALRAEAKRLTQAMTLEEKAGQMIFNARSVGRRWPGPCAGEMAERSTVRPRLRALDPGLVADAIGPLIPTGRLIAAFSGLLAFEAAGEDILPSAEKRTEKCDLLFRRRSVRDRSGAMGCGFTDPTRLILRQLADQGNQLFAALIEARKFILGGL